METATLPSLPTRRLHFEQAEPIAGKERRDLHHAGPGSFPDERHDTEVIHVLEVHDNVIFPAPPKPRLGSAGSAASSTKPTA